MKSKVRYILFGVVAYAFFLIATVPASLVYSAIQTRIPPPYRATMHGLEGTWRRGNAAAVEVRGFKIRDLQWQLRWSDLFTGRLGVDIAFKLQDGRFDGILAIGLGGQMLKSTRVNIPLAAVHTMIPDYGIQIGGTIEGALNEFAIRDGRITTGEGTFVWRDAQTIVPQRVSLGDLKADMSTVKEGVKVILSDNGGPLQLDAILMLKPDGAYDFTGFLSARDSGQQPLKDSLALLGNPGNDGRIYVSQAGRLPLLSP